MDNFEKCIHQSVSNLLDGDGSADGGEEEVVPSDGIVSRDRHRLHIMINYLNTFLSHPFVLDIGCEDIRSHLPTRVTSNCYRCCRAAMTELGRISGKAETEKVLNVIFKDFCIGK